MANGGDVLGIYRVIVNEQLKYLVRVRKSRQLRMVVQRTRQAMRRCEDVGDVVLVLSPSRRTVARWRLDFRHNWVCTDSNKSRYRALWVCFNSRWDEHESTLVWRPIPVAAEPGLSDENQCTVCFGRPIKKYWRDAGVCKRCFVRLKPPRMINRQRVGKTKVYR